MARTARKKIAIKDEGVVIADDADSLNFVGPGVDGSSGDGKNVQESIPGSSPVGPDYALQYRKPDGTFGGSANATLDASGNIIATSFVKSGGTPSQFLKADGSVDSTAYVSGTPWTGMGYLTSLSGALLDTGATIGATSQSQVFTNGITLSNLALGSIPFIGASGLVSQDNTNLNWDNTNKIIGIGATQTETSWVTFPLNASAATNTFAYAGGYYFSVTKPVILTQLGRFYATGNNQNHNVNLWDVGGSHITPIATGTVLAASSSDAKGIKYVTLGTPVLLVPGKQYALMADEFISGDTWVYNYTPNLNSALINVTGILNNAANSTYPNGTWGGINLKQIVGTPTMIFTDAPVSLSTYGVSSSGFATVSSFALPVTNSTGTQGAIYQNNQTIFHSYGTNNFFFGIGSGNFSLTVANATGNVGFGNGTLAGLTTAFNMIAVGASSLGSVRTGNNSTAIGGGAMIYATASTDNVAVGAYALASGSGNQNVAIGSSAGYTLNGNFTGTGNVIIGMNSGYGNANSLGNYNTILGFQAGQTVNGTLNGVTKSIAIGENAQVGASNTCVIGGVGAESVQVVINGTTATGQFDVNINLASRVGQIIKGFASQSGDLHQWQKSDGTIYTRITSVGKIVTTLPINTMNYTVGTLPTGARGDWAYVTDALVPAWGATVVGGGAVVTPVFYDGASWTVR